MLVALEGAAGWSEILHPAMLLVMRSITIQSAGIGTGKTQQMLVYNCIIFFVMTNSDAVKQD